MVSVPAQHLADTEFQPIDRPLRVTLGADQSLDVALMQGFLTLPFRCHDATQNLCASHNDDDPRPGSVMNYKGDAGRWREDDPCWGTWDGHEGTDFFVPIATCVVASMPGVMTHEFISPENGARVARIENKHISDRAGYFVVLLYAHHSVPLVAGVPSVYDRGEGTRVYRGQIIQLSGASGHHIPHLHFSYNGNSLPGFPEDFKNFDPYGFEFPTENALDRMSAWTVHNDPQCYP